MNEGGVEGNVKKGTPVACMRHGYVLKLWDICQERRLGRIAGELPAATT
jgi:hypothetical protein